MKVFSRKTIFEVFAGTTINLTSGWFGILLVAPGFFGDSTFEEYFKLFITNVPFGILGLLVSFWLTEKSKSL